MSEQFAAAIASSVFFLTVGGVILLRPVAARLGEYLEVLITEKRRATPSIEEGGGALGAREDVERRLDRVEERLEWAESLLARASDIPSGTPGRSR